VAVIDQLADDERSEAMAAIWTAHAAAQQRTPPQAATAPIPQPQPPAPQPGKNPSKSATERAQGIGGLIVLLLIGGCIAVVVFTGGNNDTDTDTETARAECANDLETHAARIAHGGAAAGRLLDAAERLDINTAATEYRTMKQAWETQRMDSVLNRCRPYRSLIHI